jgi:carboxypeptidase family protein
MSGDEMTRYAALSLALLAGAAPADELKWAAPGTIRAVVVDRDAHPISGVFVRVHRDEEAPTQGPVALTGPDGLVTFKKLPPGNYVITFESSGFAKTSIGPVPVQDSVSRSPRIPEFRVVLNPMMMW